MGESLEHPLAQSFRARQEHALLCYRLLMEHAEKLHEVHGDRVGTAAGVQLRLLSIVWHALNTQLGNGWIKANPDWEALRQRFIAVTERGATPYRQPTYREALAQLAQWELAHGPLPMLRRALQRLPA